METVLRRVGNSLERIMVRDSSQKIRGSSAHGNRRESPRPYMSPDDLDDFFLKCDFRHGSDAEPELDWEEHLMVMGRSRGWDTSGR